MILTPFRMLALTAALVAGTAASAGAQSSGGSGSAASAGGTAATGQPCRVIRGDGSTAISPSTTVTAGPGGVTGSTAPSGSGGNRQ